jgi:hypothetical protein
MEIRCGCRGTEIPALASVRFQRGDICPAGFLPLAVGNVRKDRVADISTVRTFLV